MSEAPGPSPEVRRVLRVEDLSKRYEESLAVSSLSFELREGEILGLVGPNGAGKTTSLRTIAGILPIQQGRVTIAGHDLALEEQAAKQALAWVPDDPQPFDSLTVHEHLEFIAHLYRVHPWRERADELLAAFELTEKRDALGGELSRGMRQKLAFACAWLSQPRLLLLDEPLSGLDPRGIRAAREAIRGLARTGVGVILSSHLLDLIEALADRILIMDRGHAVFMGTLAEARTTLVADARSSLEEIFLAATSPRAPEAGE